MLPGLLLVLIVGVNMFTINYQPNYSPGDDFSHQTSFLQLLTLTSNERSLSISFWKRQYCSCWRPVEDRRHAMSGNAIERVEMCPICENIEKILLEICQNTDCSIQLLECFFTFHTAADNGVVQLLQQICLYIILLYVTNLLDYDYCHFISQKRFSMSESQYLILYQMHWTNSYLEAPFAWMLIDWRRCSSVMLQSYFGSIQRCNRYWTYLKHKCFAVPICIIYISYIYWTDYKYAMDIEPIYHIWYYVILNDKSTTGGTLFPYS